MGLFPISSIDYENKTLAIARPIRRKLEEDDTIVHRVSFGVEVEENQMCNNCDKNQTCSLGVKCMCHPKDCKDNAIDDVLNAGLNKVVNEGRSINPFSTSLLAMISFIVGISLLFIWGDGGLDLGFVTFVLQGFSRRFGGDVSVSLHSV
ncbi:hypothetical protein ACFE04_021633 [Oxalis oulophora]